MQRFNLFIFSFPYLLIYTLSSNETHALTLNHLQTIPVKVSPMSLTFDPKGRLWTTQSVEGQCLQMYEVLEKDNTKVWHKLRICYN